MIPAEKQVRKVRLVEIHCSVERLKRMVCAARRLDPDKQYPVEPKLTPRCYMETDPIELPVYQVEYEWQRVNDNDVGMAVNFANVFLYAGNATIKVVDKEPASRIADWNAELQRRLPELDKRKH